MREADYWRQRYEMLMASFSDALKAAIDPKPPILLADKESYEAGRIAGKAEQPAQQEPLTFEQKLKIVSKAQNEEWNEYQLIEAIEAAHGIK